VGPGLAGSFKAGDGAPGLVFERLLSLVVVATVAGLQGDKGELALA